MTMNGRIIVDGTLRGDAMTMNGDVTVAGIVTGDVRTFRKLRCRPHAPGTVWGIPGGRASCAPSRR